MEDIVGQAKWITTNHTKCQSSPKEDVEMVRLEQSPSLWALSRKPNNSFQQVGQLKAALDEKCPIENIIFHQNNTRHMFLSWPGKNCYSLAGKFQLIHHIEQTLQLLITIYFSLYKILLMEKISTPLEDSKRHLKQFFAQKDKLF